MIDTHLKYDNMYKNGMFYALIIINYMYKFHVIRADVPRPNGIDLHFCIPFELSIEDEDTNQMIMPKISLLIPMFFDKKSILRYFE